MQSEGQSCCALYELEEVEAGLMHSGLTSRLTLSLLSAITNCACPGPNGGRVGIYWGGGDTPYIAPTTSSIRALTDIAQPLLPFLPSWDVAGGRGGMILPIWVGRLFSCDPTTSFPHLSESVFTRNHWFSRRSPSRPVVHFLC